MPTCTINSHMSLRLIIGRCHFLTSTVALTKEDLVCEFYLNEIHTSLYKKVMAQLRGGLLELRANTGR